MLKLILVIFCITAINKRSVSQTDSVNNQTTITVDEKVFTKVEIEAGFPGGTNEWVNYLRRNLDANIPVKKKAPAGTYQVIVRFQVSRDGKVKDVMAETAHGYGMEKEVIRIIKKGPKWLPAQQGGRTVSAYRRQPVTFVVSEE
jgi:protein TonB